MIAGLQWNFNRKNRAISSRSALSRSSWCFWHFDILLGSQTCNFSLEGWGKQAGQRRTATCTARPEERRLLRFAQPPSTHVTHPMLQRLSPQAWQWNQECFSDACPKFTTSWHRNRSHAWIANISVDFCSKSANRSENVWVYWKG